MDRCACGTALAVDARFCPTCGTPVERRPPPADERKVATVVFADLVGSTALADSENDPERTRVLLDRFYDAMAEEIEEAGGTVEKFVGDAVMAAFGAPAALEDHAERALHAALAMQQRLRRLHGDRLALRIGVNTGDVVIGRPREGSSFVTGDVVNVAARLEQAASPGEIMVGERTATAARGAFEFAEPVRLEAKGKPGGVAARRLVRALSLMRPRGVPGLQEAFVGREPELARLREVYERVVEHGEPHLLALIGDAGVGKTRLVREVWQWLAAQDPQPLQRTGRCLSYGRGVGYWPLAEILREHFALSDGETPEVIVESLGRHPSLALTLGVESGEEIHPLVARERLHDAWAEFLEEEALSRPAVVLIEDVHWADDELCDLLELLVTRVTAPLLVLVTARPEFLERRPALCGARRNTAGVTLETLPPAHTRELLERLLGSEPPPLVQQIVVDRAEGNPFFVEELVATFIDRGVLERRNGGWHWSDLPEGFRIPDTVHAVLAARIDLLPPAEKAALQAAAVIGRIFWTGPVYELVGRRPDFALLEERDFCRRRGGSTLPGEREYAIKHALTREVAYESVPKARRAQLHAAFAAWLERSVETADDHSAMLAHHYAEAVRPEDLDIAWPGREPEVEELRARAATWARRAAAHAIGRYEIDEAIELLRGALLHVTEPLEQAELWYEIGRASALKYDGEGFTAAMEQAIELGGPSAEVYAELAFQTVQRAGMWQRRPDRGVVDGWIRKALELSPPRSPQRTKAVVSDALWNPAPAASAAALAEAEALADPELSSHALLAAAYGALHDGEIDRAAELVHRERELLPLIADPDHRANAQLTAVEVLTAASRFDELPPVLAALDDVAQGLTPHHRLHAAAGHTSVTSFAGRWEELCAFSPTLEVAVAANLTSPCPFNVLSLLLDAAAHQHLGRSDEARRLEAAADEIGMEGYGPMFDPARLRLALARGDAAEVERLVAALPGELFDRYGHAAYEAAAAQLDAYVALGDRARAEAAARRWLARGSAVEAFALRALGWARDEDALVEQAARRFAELGLDWHASETRRLLEVSGSRRT